MTEYNLDEIRNKLKTYLLNTVKALDDGTFENDDTFEFIFNEGMCIIDDLKIVQKDFPLLKEDIEKFIDAIDECIESYCRYEKFNKKKVLLQVLSNKFINV